MYAVVSSGGKQYRVEPGTTLTMERIGAAAGEPFTFERVLLIGDGEQVTVGTPVVSGASVSATVLGDEPGPKLVVFKFKQKVKYRRRTGHRQHLVRVRIDAINADGKSTKAAAPAQTEPKATEAKAAAKPARKPAARSKAASEATEPAAKAPAKPRAARKPAAKAETAKASVAEEKPKARRTSTRKKAAPKQPADEAGEKPEEQ
ncbi:MAG TPA: 50S ribosomal protein L21 [Candidatus Limnocylindrales bacterium]|nr:50S ribosomal protein L21 [Candidatus Limnocylindrales bacterium]